MAQQGYIDEQGFFQQPQEQQQQQPYYDPQQQNTGYDMGGNQQQYEQQYPQDQQFGQFDYTQGGAAGAGYMPPADGPFVDMSQQQNTYTGSIMTPDPNSAYQNKTMDSYEDEPPLLEELGINFDHIRQKTLAVLYPGRTPDLSVMQDTDLAGPLVFCLAFGGSLLLSGKVHFSYIYGIGVVGCLAMYVLLNLMSLTGVSVTCVFSVLGYCLLPMVLLSFYAVIMSLQGLFGGILTSAVVIWCSVSASKLFVSALSMDQQQLLVGYPCALVYAVFALMAVF